MHDALVHERELLLRKRKRLLAKMDTTAVERALVNNEQLIPVCLRINELTDQINTIRSNLIKEI